MDLQLELLQKIHLLENIENIENKVELFEHTRVLIQKLYSETSLGRKELKFVLNSLKGLIGGFEVFTLDEILTEIVLILDKLVDIKEHLKEHLRNSLFKVPEGTSYLDLEFDHFIQLAKLQGLNKVIKNLEDLKEQDPSLKGWADDLISYLREHRAEVNKKGSFKEQLSCLKTIGMGFENCVAEKGSLTLENANFIQKLSKNTTFLKEGEEGWISSPVLISCFDRIILKKLEELGYKFRIFAGQYVIIDKAKCYGIRAEGIESVQEAIKKLAPLISPTPYIPVGMPLLCRSGTHYYWLCFEFSSFIRMWDFL